MADPGVRYLGMELRSPLVASSSPLTGSLAGLGRLDRHGFATLDQLRGRLSQRSVPDPAAFERANHIKTLASQTGPRSGSR